MKPQKTTRGYEIAGRMPLFQKWGRDAIREDRKTMTRRVIKTPAETGNFNCSCPWKVGEYRVMTEPLKKVGSFTYYLDTNEDVFDLEGDPMFWRWKKDILSAMFMPTEAARTICQITNIRVERVQDITEADSIAEGSQIPCAEFSRIWDPINKKRGYGWDVNPWVWVVEFKKI